MSMIHVHLFALLAQLADRTRRGQRGQSTAEYALVILGAVTVAGAFIAWAGSTGLLSDLFDGVLETVIGGLGG